MGTDKKLSTNPKSRKLIETAQKNNDVKKKNIVANTYIKEKLSPITLAWESVRRQCPTLSKKKLRVNKLLNENKEVKLIQIMRETGLTKNYLYSQKVKDYVSYLKEKRKK